MRTSEKYEVTPSTVPRPENEEERSHPQPPLEPLRPPQLPSLLRHVRRHAARRRAAGLVNGGWRHAALYILISISYEIKSRLRKEREFRGTMSRRSSSNTRLGRVIVRRRMATRSAITSLRTPPRRTGTVGLVRRSAETGAETLQTDAGFNQTGGRVRGGSVFAQGAQGSTQGPPRRSRRGRRPSDVAKPPCGRAVHRSRRL